MKEIKLNTSKREEILDITKDVRNIVANSKVENGIMIICTKHTTTGLTINENADPDVKKDMLMGLKDIVKNLDYTHAEGNSDSHIKSSLMGSSVTVLIQDGDLVLGTWQGIMFCEFDGPRSRTAVVKVIKDASN